MFSDDGDEDDFTKHTNTRKMTMAQTSAPALVDTNNDSTMTTTADTNNHHSPHEQELPAPPWYSNPLQVTAMISNFSTSYNVVNISLVLPIMEQLEPATDEDKAFVASSLLLGMIVGQVLGGLLGDSCLGRLQALRFVMLLQIVASLGSAAATDYFRLATWRLILGIGAGGVYPLAAVLSAEQGGGDDTHHQPRTTAATTSNGSIDRSRAMPNDESLHRVVLTFSMQGAGFAAVPLAAVLLLYTISNLEVVWRIIVGLGSLPGLALMLLQYRVHTHRTRGGQRHVLPTHAEEEHEKRTANPGSDSPRVDGQPHEAHDFPINTEEADGVFRDQAHKGWWDAVRHEEALVQKLLGTAVTWFLFDVCFYGNELFQPIVIEAAFGARSASNPLHLLQRTSMDSLLLTLIALPGYAVAGLTLGVWQTPRFVMMQGFAVMSILYLAIGVTWSELRHVPIVLVLLYGLTFFFANYGPNTTTFVLPSLVYSPECRTTFNGISAACGKLGALCGATLFAIAADAWGDRVVMLICSCIALVAFVMTKRFVRIQTDMVLTDSRHIE
eukprot:scaffold1695_cov167-Amphora_coffeaeformis.AAC.13